MIISAGNNFCHKTPQHLGIKLRILHTTFHDNEKGMKQRTYSDLHSNRSREKEGNHVTQCKY